MDVDESLFKPHRIRTGISEITEEEFIFTFEDKLGPSFFLKNLFRAYEKEKDSGLMEQKKFFELLAVLQGISSVSNLEVSF